MDMHLKGKQALVTGSNFGIGEGIAHVLAREGAVVMVHGRNEERCRAAVEAITSAGDDASFIIGDLANDADCNDLADEVM